MRFLKSLFRSKPAPRARSIPVMTLEELSGTIVTTPKKVVEPIELPEVDEELEIELTGIDQSWG